MSSRQLLRLAAVLGALLLAWGAVAIAGRRSADGGAGSTRLLALDTSAVDTVVIAGQRDTTVLARNPDGWRVNGFRAGAEEITTLLEALADTSAYELAAESKGSHRRLGVDADSGRRLRAAGKDKAVELVVGGAPAFGAGYVRRANESAVYRVKGRLPELAGRRPDEWRDKTIVAVSADSIAQIQVRRGRERYALTRDGSRWQLATGEAVDSSRAAELARALGQIRAAGFATAGKRDSLRFSRPDRTLTLKNAGGRTLAAVVFDSTESGIWVRHDTGGPVWRMESWDVDRLTPSASSLR